MPTPISRRRALLAESAFGLGASGPRGANDLRTPASNPLEGLGGTRRGQNSVRINVMIPGARRADPAAIDDWSQRYVEGGIKAWKAQGGTGPARDSA
ncbi:MAG: hypothetical protein WB810_05600 [Candidatus Cybelea sp.]